MTEAFSNVLRHAHAKRVTVAHVLRQPSDFTLEIRDDGVGHDASAAPGPRRAATAQGLANMRRRAELLDATLSIESAPGRGTRVCLTMPVATAPRTR